MIKNLHRLGCNRKRRMLVTVAEFAVGCVKGEGSDGSALAATAMDWCPERIAGSRPVSLLAALLAGNMVLLPAYAGGLPQGHGVVGGTASIQTPSANQMVINVSGAKAGNVTVQAGSGDTVNLGGANGLGRLVAASADVTSTNKYYDTNPSAGDRKANVSDTLNAFYRASSTSTGNAANVNKVYGANVPSLNGASPNSGMGSVLSREQGYKASPGAGEQRKCPMGYHAGPEMRRCWPNAAVRDKR